MVFTFHFFFSLKATLQFAINHCILGAIFGKVWILKCMSLSLIFNHCVHKLGYRILRKVSGRELLKKSHPSKNTFRVSYSCHGGQKVGLGLQMNWWESFLEHLTTFGLHIFAHFCSFAIVVSGEILLRMVVTRRSILAQRPLFAQAGIPISQSVYRGQPGKNKMGRFQILHRNMFYCL